MHKPAIGLVLAALLAISLAACTTPTSSCTAPPPKLDGEWVSIGSSPIAVADVEELHVEVETSFDGATLTVWVAQKGYQPYAVKSENLKDGEGSDVAVDLDTIDKHASVTFTVWRCGSKAWFLKRRLVPPVPAGGKPA